MPARTHAGTRRRCRHAQSPHMHGSSLTLTRVCCCVHPAHVGSQGGVLLLLHPHKLTQLIQSKESKDDRGGKRPLQPAHAFPTPGTPKYYTIRAYRAAHVKVCCSTCSRRASRKSSSAASASDSPLPQAPSAPTLAAPCTTVIPASTSASDTERERGTGTAGAGGSTAGSTTKGAPSNASPGVPATVTDSVAGESTAAASAAQQAQSNHVLICVR